MNKDVADMWVAALRSGEYQQGRGQLRKGDTFCCLGVLCDLHRRRTNQGEWRDDDSCGRNGFAYQDMWSEMHDQTFAEEPPPDVTKWAGINMPNPWVPTHVVEDIAGNNAHNTIAALNDSTRLSFKDLADIIEDNWQEL